MAFTNPSRTCENVQERLIYERGILHRKWKDIQSEGFSAVPIGTLYKIMQTGKVPRKYWRALGIKAKRHPRIAISKIDMKKAACSITNNIGDRNVIELVYLLSKHLYEQRGEAE